MNQHPLQSKKWLETPSVSVPDDLLHWLAQVLEVDESPPSSGLILAAQTLLRRGLSGREEIQAFLDPACYTSASPYDLPGMDAAVQRLQQALHKQEKILVWGDFDVDGQTSTTILVSTLRQIGALCNLPYPGAGT